MFLLPPMNSVSNQVAQVFYLGVESEIVGQPFGASTPTALNIVTTTSPTLAVPVATTAQTANTTTPTPTTAPPVIVWTPQTLPSPWSCIVFRESSDQNIVSPDGAHFGYFQFTISSWHEVGGVGLPTQASLQTQFHFAKALQKLQGWRAWETAPLCGEP